MQIPKRYRGYEIRFNRTKGILQSNRPTDVLVSDSPSARDWKTLRTLLDCIIEGF